MENVSHTNKTRKILLLIMYVVFLKVSTFLWIILILYPGHTSLFLETVTMKFGEPKGRGPVYGTEGWGPRISILYLQRAIPTKLQWKEYMPGNVLIFSISKFTLEHQFWSTVVSCIAHTFLQLICLRKYFFQKSFLSVYLFYVFKTFAEINNVGTKTNFSSSATKVIVGLHVKTTPSKIFNDKCKSSGTIWGTIIRR